MQKQVLSMLVGAAIATSGAIAYQIRSQSIAQSEAPKTGYVAQASDRDQCVAQYSILAANAIKYGDKFAVQSVQSRLRDCEKLDRSVRVAQVTK
jgi:hypothetical protein